MIHLKLSLLLSLELLNIITPSIPTTAKMVTTRKRKSQPAPPPSPQSKRSRKPAAANNAPPASAPTTSSKRARRKGKDHLSTLPYHILLEIFLYASCTPRASNRHSWPDSSSLLALATVCRGFYEPAIAALYRDPVTLPAQRGHQLWKFVRERPDMARKIQYLTFYVDPLLRLAAPGYGHFDVARFVRCCGNLKELWIAHLVDDPPYEFRDAPKWKYPPALFEALEGRELDAEVPDLTPVRLKSWRWNGLLLNGYIPETMAKIHLDAFQSLRRLSAIYVSDEQFIATLAFLPGLEELELECCSSGPEEVVELAKAARDLRLKSLSFINCEGLESESLIAFLLSPTCSSLEHLRIEHCSDCNLEFLPALSNTPGLKSLSFDGRYYAKTKAGYTTLLPGSVVPVWPPALQSIKLINLHKWSGAEVEMFLNCLLAAAPELPRVRELTLHCILNLGWRERATIRDEYENKLLHAFVRPYSEPSLPTAESPAPLVASTSPSEKPQRRSLRVHPKQKEDAPPRETGGEATFRGFCERDRVDIKMDNARPAETQFDEDDFV